ncbi:MAG: alpha/beta fold hydrolase [Cyanobacteria bacterium HKST-UBA02]|nr:alpha/beta fold hydrolase [Cyanobacteria bacterium HKST-UBA02]
MLIALATALITGAGVSPVVRAAKSAPAGVPAVENLEGGLSTLHWKGSTGNNTTFVCVHALGLSAGAFEDFGKVMSRRGYDVYSLEVRGFGPERRRPGFNRMDMETSVDDLKKFLTFLRHRSPGRKIVLFGESMGGAITMKTVSEVPELVDGAVVSAPAWQLYKLKRITMKGLGDLVLPAPGFAAKSVMRQATTSPTLIRTWTTNPDDNIKLKLSLGEAYNYYRFIKQTPSYGEKIENTPMMVMQGFKDNLAKASGTARLFSMIKSPQKQFLLSCDSEHLMLEEGQLSPKVTDVMLSFVKNQVLSGKEALKTRLVVLDRSRLEGKDKLRVDRLIKLSGANKPMLSVTRAEKKLPGL